MEVNDEFEIMDMEDDEFEFTLSELASTAKSADSPGISLVSQPLTGDNYAFWSHAMIVALLVKNKLRFIDGSITKPDGSDLNLLQSWIQNNNVVISWIINAVSKEIFIMEMENLFKDMCEKFISQSFCQELATKFSHSVYRSEKFPVKWEQVRRWFQDKQSTLSVKTTPSFSPKETLASPRALPVKRRVSTISISEAAVELPNLMFEARSAKDCAWFDVAYFLNFRVLNSGELMVRVRFAGFDREEDEWVSADRAIRERSIPLVPTECNSVNVGDQVLCYRVNEYHALYVDAHVIEIERRSHDESGCTCVFNVHYEYDNFEDKVGCNNLCRRPTQSLSKESKASGFSIAS